MGTAMKSQLFPYRQPFDLYLFSHLHDSINEYQRLFSFFFHHFQLRVLISDIPGEKKQNPDSLAARSANAAKHHRKEREKKDKELNQIQDEMDNITHTVGKSNTVHKSSLKEALLL